MDKVKKITHLNVTSVSVYATENGPAWGISGSCKFEEEGATDHEHEEKSAEGSQNPEAKERDRAHV